MSRARPMAAQSNHQCDVWELARCGGEVTGHLPLQQATRLAEALVDTDGQLNYRLTGYIDARNRAAATLQLDGVLRARCDRCAGPVEMHIAEQAAFYFVDDEEQLARLPIDEAPEEPLLGSRRFDVAALVEDQAILALPISPRHDACVLAGQSDETSAAAHEAESRRPFASLAALKRGQRKS